VDIVDDAKTEAKFFDCRCVRRELRHTSFAYPGSILRVSFNRRVIQMNWPNETPKNTEQSAKPDQDNKEQVPQWPGPLEGPLGFSES
jgi:hypothetical protein